MEEEEEMWFNEDDDFDEPQTVLSSNINDIDSISTKQIDTDLDSIGKIIDKKQEANGPKINNNSSQKPAILNNNANAGAQPPGTPIPNDSRLQLFKRVSAIYFVVFFYAYLNLKWLYIDDLGIAY